MDSKPETELWVVCPVCHKPSPAGTEFCKNCWGAIIHAGKPVSYEKAQKISKRWLFYRKRRKTIKVIALSLTSLIILAAIVYPSLYYLTDIVYQPSQGINSGSLPGEWAMFRHDPRHSGSTGSSDSLPQGTIEWVFPSGSGIHSSPAVADGTVYVGSRDFKLYALDAATGAKRWEYETGSWVESSPVIANGVVYFGSNDGKLYALEARSGEKLWDFKTAYPIMSSPAVADGIVYFGSDDYYVYALDAKQGTKLWAFDTKGPVKSSPTVASGIVYIGSGSNFGYALEALSGRLRLHFKSHYPGFSSPAVSDGIFYFSNSNGNLFAVDGNARTWLWEHDIKPLWTQLWLMSVPGVSRPPPQSGSLWGLSLGRTGSSSPAVAGDTLYIGSDNKLLAIDLQSQQKRWEFETGGAIISSPAVADTTVYVGSEDGRLYAINAASGEKLWDIITGGQITSSPAVADGTVYIGSYDGNLYAIK
ncbi:MAG: PQQ-binding-like beta-propeller repeat protein [Chloroflexi bacterium]|nr:PQQ-binding-like beta-propeller repeat protein [Chloroflexota bacterium]